MLFLTQLTRNKRRRQKYFHVFVYDKQTSTVSPIAGRRTWANTPPPHPRARGDPLITSDCQTALFQSPPCPYTGRQRDNRIRFAAPLPPLLPLPSFRFPSPAQMTVTLTDVNVRQSRSRRQRGRGHWVITLVICSSIQHGGNFYNRMTEWLPQAKVKRP